MIEFNPYFKDLIDAFYFQIFIRALLVMSYFNKEQFSPGIGNHKVSISTWN